jgi:hypothetical protein
MSEEYEFETSEVAHQFCSDIIEQMVALFGIGRAEAFQRINRQWRNLPFTSADDVRHHEDANYWAHRIYYEDNIQWWLPGAELKPKALL